MLIQNNKVIYHKIKSFNGKKLPIWNTCVFWLPEFLKSDIFVFWGSTGVFGWDTIKKFKRYISAWKCILGIYLGQMLQMR